MAESGNAAKDDADGLTMGARRAKDFEAERQRMKEEWKREQAQKTGGAKAVSQACLFTIELPHALKTSQTCHHNKLDTDWYLHGYPATEPSCAAMT